MASCITEQWKGSVCPQARLTVTTTSDNATSMTVQWVVEYVTHDGYSAHTNGIPRDWKVTINGSQVGSGSYNINYVSSTREIGRGTYTISKGYSGQNISFGLSFYFDVSWSGVYRGTMTASGSFWLGAKNYYTVSYYANGGSWSPSNQTKWHDENLTLSHSHATRTGYKFKGWSTSTDSSIEYYAGSTYTGNSNLNLYAVWEADTYTVSYNANGGSNAPANQTKYYNTNLTLSSTRPTRTNYNFIGWGTSSGSTSADYQPGGTYTSNAPITLYAIWELAYLKPRITDVSVDRCNPDGTLSEEGTNAKVVCKWATDRPVTEIALWSKQVPNGSWVKYASTPNGTTSGSISQVIGNSTLSTEFAYSICIEVKDGASATYTSEIYRDLPPLDFIMDIHSSGKGVAFGRPAIMSGVADFEYKVLARKDIEVNQQICKDIELGGSWIKARDNATVRNKRIPDKPSSYYPIVSSKTPNGSWSIGTLGENLYMSYDTDTNYTSGNNTSKAVCVTPETLLKNNTNSTFLTQDDLLVATSLDGHYGRYIKLNGAVNSSDKYYININSSGEVFSGMQLNNAPNVTLKRLAFVDEPNKVLFEGALAMSDSQVANLTEAISKQRHGIIIVFSCFESNQVQNYEFFSFFIPKEQIKRHNGCGISFPLLSSWRNGCKYLYIYDGQIKGNSINQKQITVGNISYNNAQFVLRYVYGV